MHRLKSGFPSNILMLHPKRLAYHVVYDRSLEDALQYAASNDWTGIVPDISVPSFSPERYTSTHRNVLRSLSLDLGIEWGFHAPGDDVSLKISYSPIRVASLDYIKSIIDFARDVSTTKVNLVVHSGESPHFRKARAQTDEFIEDYHNLFLESLVSSLLELIDYGHPDVRIVLENYKWSKIDHEAITRLIPRGLKLCLDIPKLFDQDMSVREPDLNIFEKYSPYIEVVHLHDIDPKYGSHQVFGTGIIDFREILTLLASLTFSPLYVFEVRPREAAQESLRNFKQLLQNERLSLL